MTRQVDHIVLLGGLDYISSPLTISPGRLWRALNFEPVEAGYRRIFGYERFDGRPAPSDAAYWVLGRTLASGQSDPEVGTTVTGADSEATGIVLDIAFDEWVLREVVGVFDAGEELQVAGTTIATASGVARGFGTATIADDLDYRDRAAKVRRDVITKVPGSGPVRGIWTYMFDVFAVRDNAAGTAGVMHRATPDGWEVVASVTLPPGGTYRFLNHNFMGQAGSLTMFGVNGVGKAFSILKGGTAETPTWTFASLSAIGGDEGAALDKPTHISVQNNHLMLAYRGGSLLLSAVGDPGSFDATMGASEIATGQEINGLLGGVGLGNTVIMGDDHIQVLYGNDSDDFVLQDQSQSSTGGVEDSLQSVGGPLYLDNRGVRSMTTTEAWGNWVIGTMTSDIQPWLDRQRTARNVAVGSMRVRSSDQYRLWFESGIGLILYVGRQHPEICLLDYGSDEDITLDFDAGQTEPVVGHILTGEVSRATARIDQVKTTSGSWAGNDAAGTLHLYDVVGKFQNDEMLTTTSGPIAEVDGDATPDAHKIIPCVSVSAEDSDRIERVYFGCESGFVYEADRGRSFDGRSIEAFARLPLNHTGKPTEQKRFIRADVHCDVPGGQATIGLSAIYDDGRAPEQVLEDGEIAGGGGFWDEALYDEFVWDTPLNGYHVYDLAGIGRNASLLMISNQSKEASWTLNGISLHHSPRRAER